MEVFALLPGIIALLLAVHILSSIFNKHEELTWRIWKLIFGVMLTVMAIYLVGKGLKEVHHVIY
jgi:hypothetical protein